LSILDQSEYIRYIEYIISLSVLDIYEYIRSI